MGRWNRCAADATGLRHVRMPDLGRVELSLGEDTTARFPARERCARPLPPGSQLDAAMGMFTWTPAAGYIGIYDLVFLQGATQLSVAVTIEPKSNAAAGRMEGWIDLPATRATVVGCVHGRRMGARHGRVAGSGVGAVHVWA